MIVYSKLISDTISNNIDKHVSNKGKLNIHTHTIDYHSRAQATCVAWTISQAISSTQRIAPCCWHRSCLVHATNLPHENDPKTRVKKILQFVQYLPGSRASEVEIIEGHGRRRRYATG